MISLLASIFIFISIVYSATSSVEYTQIVPRVIEFETYPLVPNQPSYSLTNWTCTANMVASRDDGQYCSTILGTAYAGGAWDSSNYAPPSSPSIDLPAEANLDVWYQSKRIVFRDFGFDELMPPQGITISGVRLTVVKKAFPSNKTSPVSSRDTKVWVDLEFDGANKVYDKEVFIRLPNGQLSGNKGIFPFFHFF